MKRLVVSLATSMMIATTAFAQDPVDLKARVDALERKLARFAQVAAESGTAGAAVQKVAAKVVALEQAIEAIGRSRRTHIDLVARSDDLERRLGAAEFQVNELASRLGSLEQPSVSDQGEHDAGGFVVTSEDGRYALTIGAYVQPRFEATLAHDLSAVDSAGFRLRRARLMLHGRIGARLTATLMPELGTADPSLQDAYVDYELPADLVLRVGQTKMPFTRQWITPSYRLEFLERTAGLDNLRYDRDLGLWLRGRVLGGRVAYVVGVANGAGRNVDNDNVDVAEVIRVDAAITGARFEGAGDLERSRELRLMIGAGAVHDLRQLPGRVGGIDTGERDVDADGTIDNVRVLSASADLAGRWNGFELTVEGMFRLERWGTILDHSANRPLAEAVAPAGNGDRRYFGGYASLSYVPAPGWLLVGARLAETRLSLLGVGGLVVESAPPTDRLVEADLTAQLIVDGHRTLGLGYTMFDHRGGAVEAAAARFHRLILEYQWVL